MQGFHMQICSLIIPWQMEYVEVYSLHISVILFNCPSVPHGQSFYNKLVLETYNEDAGPEQSLVLFFSFLGS